MDLELVDQSDSGHGESAKQFLATHMVELSKKIGCYKISVRCTEDQVEFYNGVGFKCEPNNSNSMILKFDEERQVVSSTDLQGS